jgi:transaldolase
MEALSAEAIPVNATLVFSKEQALSCADAFDRAQKSAGRASDSVISIFVSRFDRALDDELESKGIKPSFTGIYNAAAIYNAIEAMGLQQCRILFASTGVKGDALRPSYYVEELLAPNSINTAPVETIEAYLRSGSRSVKLPIDEEVIEAHFKAVADAGIDFNFVVQKQIDDGLSAFKDAFADILTALE